MQLWASLQTYRIRTSVREAREPAFQQISPAILPRKKIKTHKVRGENSVVYEVAGERI